MTITPTELTEIERKARAYQAEEAENPEAKTCHRPTPELVLRLVEEIKDWKRSCEIEEKKACDNHERADKAELDALRQHNESGMLRIERDELRAKADQLREQNAGMGVELLGKDDTIKELRAKVAELEKAKGGLCMDCSKSSDEINALSSEVSRLEAEIIRKDDQWEARVRELEEAIKVACAEIAKYAAESGRLQAIVDRLPLTADGVPITPGMVLFADTGTRQFGIEPTTVSKGLFVGHHASGIFDDRICGGGHHTYYSTREAAQAQKGGKQ